MRTFLTIFCAACLWLALPTTPLRAQVVSIDFSQAVEMKVVWKMALGGEANPMTFHRDFGGKLGFDVLTTGIGGSRRNQTWATRPKLDTTNLFNWLGINNASFLQALDYDGVPPLEYVNAKGIIWRCAQGESPFPLRPIDTAAYATCTGEPQVSADVDGDGFLDVITDIGGDGQTARIVMGGPQAGKGCERVFAIPKVSKDGYTSYTKAFYRSTAGTWRLVQVENADATGHATLALYDVLLTHEGGKPKATIVQRDSLKYHRSQGEVFGDAEVLVDTAAGKDWLLVARVVGDPANEVLERFDVTDGRLNTTGEQVTGYVFYDLTIHNLGYTMGTSKPVIAILGLFCYADNIRQPFARVVPAQALGGFSEWTAINDQTGDGKPDILMSNWPSPNGEIQLLSLDSSVTSVAHAVNETGGASARLTGDILEVTLAVPVMVSAQIVSLDGRTTPLLAPVPGTVGMNRYDLSAALRRIASGAYHLRVRVGESFLTIPILR